MLNVEMCARVVIVGAGLTGLSSAYALEQLGLDYILVEKRSHIGGLCSTSITEEGFVFDKSMHVFHSRTRWVRSLIQTLLDEGGIKLVEHVRKAKILFEGEYLPYPFQASFYFLSNKQVLVECIDGIKKALSGQKLKPHNFEQYVKYHFGHGISKHFMIPYNKKLWTIPLSGLSYEWAEEFVPKPELNEILQAALRRNQSIQALDREWGYNSRFVYPEKGGIQNIPEAFLRHLSRGKMILDRKVCMIDVKRRQVMLDDGATVDYDVLVSTMPLPQLIRIIRSAPSAVRDLADSLNYVSVFNINLGVVGKTGLDANWVYFPQRDIIFHRVGFPSTLSPNMAPSDCTSLSVEISYSKFRPLKERKKLRRKTISDLVRIGLIKSEDDIVSEHEHDLKYAYVLYDKNYNFNRIKAHAFLEGYNIHSIGRFGSWKYLTMEDSIIEGCETVRRLLRVKDEIESTK